MTEEKKTEEPETTEQKTEEPTEDGMIRIMEAVDAIMNLLKSAEFTSLEKIFTIALVSSVVQTDATMNAMNAFAKDMLKDADISELIRSARIVAVGPMQTAGSMRPIQRDPKQS